MRAPCLELEVGQKHEGDQSMTFGCDPRRLKRAAVSDG